MSFKEVKELKQAGKLDEALEMASQDLEADPNNIWNKRSIVWVYYELLKLNADIKNFAAFKENLIKIKELELPEDENMVFDNCAWQIGSLVYNLQKQESTDYSKINELFEIIKDFHFTKPSEAYSFIYRAFHKGYHNWSRYLTFADWWNFDNLRPEDYLKEEFKSKKIMSIAEQAYIAYSKKLLEGESLDPFGQQRIIDQEKIQEFLPKLDALIEKQPNYQYPPYFKAKLLLALGNDENVLSAFLPFAKQKRNDFWVWDLMAEIFKDDKDIQFACYCKALSLRTREDFLVKLRQTFAEKLIIRKMYNEAKTEIQKVIAIREKEGWQLPNQIKQWTEQDWYTTAESTQSNKTLYKKHIGTAEEILFQDIPEEVIVVEFVNHNKKMLNFVQDEQRFGFFKYEGLLNKPKVGDILKVRFKGKNREKGGFYSVFTATKADPNISSKAIKSLKGNLNIHGSNNFGFVDNIFVGPKLIDENNLENGQNIIGKAILSYNKKKNEWGWKAIDIL